MAVVFVVSIATFVEVDIDREAIGESLQEMVDDQSQYVVSWSFNLAGGLLLIVAGVGFFLVMRSYDEALAVTAMVGLTAAGVTLVAATMSYFVLFFLANDFVLLDRAEAAALKSTARAVGLAAITIYLTGLTLVGVGLVPVGVMIAGSKAVPAWMGWWAVVSGVLMLFTWAILAYAGAGFAVIAAGSVGALLFFAIMGLWLIIRGLPIPVTE